MEAFLFVAPHVEIRIRTADNVVYTAEWRITSVLTNWGISSDTIKAGDHVIVRGSPYKDPSVRKLTLLAEVRRPSDGWIWNSPVDK